MILKKQTSKQNRMSLNDPRLQNGFPTRFLIVLTNLQNSAVTEVSKAFI